MGLEKLLSNKWGHERDLVMALVCGRVLEPSSKLALAQALLPGSAHHTLGQELGVAGAREDELYGAMDWLLERQERISERAARGFTTSARPPLKAPPVRWRSSAIRGITVRIACR